MGLGFPRIFIFQISNKVAQKPAQQFMNNLHSSMEGLYSYGSDLFGSSTIIRNGDQDLTPSTKSQ